MKIVIIAVLIFMGGIFVGIGGLGEITKFTTMSISETKQKFGYVPFVEKDFAKGSVELRAKMAASLVEINPYKGQPLHSVYDKLGYSDGFYFSNKIPAYMIQNRSEGNKEATSWQVIFLADEGEKVEEVVVHKNCCYKNIGVILDLVK